ncbi:MAG: hypothetical protein M5U28_36105 [Sandaracinaceae bacterium]|nr:hypothetical protein [Sandaracinaceae bacterium]
MINALAIADRDALIDPIAVWCALSQAGAEVVLTPDKPYVGETGLVTDTVRLSSGWTIAVTGASFFTVATWWPPGSDCPALLRGGLRCVTRATSWRSPSCALCAPGATTPRRALVTRASRSMTRTTAPPSVVRASTA